MDWLDAFILGLVQGLAEYLPISSSGHLEIGQHLLGLNIAGADSLAFDVTLHVATVLSTVVILWREFSAICTSFFTWRRDENFTLLMKILVSCIPVGVVGVLFKKQIEGFFGSNLPVVGTCLIITAALLAFAYFFRTRPLRSRDRLYSSEDSGRPISYLDAFIIGCAQAIAVLPGLSRSGSTIATGIILGNKRGQLARFSFLMVIIPILGQALLDIVKNVTHPEETAQAAVGFVPLAVGFITAFVVGCIACRWMIDLVKRGKLIWFAVYCLIVGAVCLICA
jgi:undecaprenyl-diphosphatase